MEAKSKWVSKAAYHWGDKMAKGKSLLKNSIFNAGKTFFSLVFPVMTFTYASRILGDVGIGKVNFSRSVITYFTMLASLGMRYYGTREAAKLRDDRLAFNRFVHEMLIINLMMTLLSYALLFTAMAAVPKLKSYETLLLVNSAAIALEGLGMEWLYQSVEEYRYIALRSVLFQVIGLVCLFIFVREADDVLPYTIVLLAAGSGAYILNFINARKYISFRRCGPYHFKRHIKPLLWLLAMALSIELYTVLDSTMLGFLKGDAAVGRYTAAVKINKTVNSLITSVGVVLIPRLSYYIGQRKDNEVRELVNKTYNYMFMLSIPAAIGLFLLSDEIILLFSGRGFASAAGTMRLLTPIVVIIPFSVITNLQIFVPMAKEKLILQSTLAGAVINFTLNQLLIPRYAENGAAVATVVAEAAVTTICLVNIGRFYDRRAIFAKYHQYWLAAMAIPLSVAVCRLLPVGRWIGMAIMVGLSVVAYFSVLFALKNPYLLEARDIVKRKIHFLRSKKDKGNWK